MFTSNIGHRSAREVCQDVISYARVHFNDTAEATQLFREWGIQSSENVGRIVFAMVRAGLLRARPEDHQEDFNGLFRVEDVFRDQRDNP